MEGRGVLQYCKRLARGMAIIARPTEVSIRICMCKPLFGLGLRKPAKRTCTLRSINIPTDMEVADTHAAEASGERHTHSDGL